MDGKHCLKDSGSEAGQWGAHIRELQDMLKIKDAIK